MKILIVDLGFNQTMYLTAEMAAAGIEVVLVSPDAPAPTGVGRYCRQIQSPGLTEEGYDDFILDVVRREPADLIFPAAEPVQHLLWARAAELASPVFPSVTSTQEELLADRRRLYEHAASLDVPIPAFESVTDDDALADAVARVGLPCVLRGTQGMSGEQVHIVRSFPEALTALRRLRTISPSTPFVQEYIEGPRCLIGGLLHNGSALQWFSQQTIENSSPPAGPSIRVRSHVNAELTKHAERLLGSLAWHGLACAEFIRREDGSYRFLEINPRPWAAIQAAEYCGVPLLKLFVAYLQGRRDHTAVEYRDGIECTLFPAFPLARIRAREFPRWRDVNAYGQCLRAAPWRRRALMKHFMRSIWWTLDAMKRSV